MLQKEVPSPERPWVKIYAIMLRSAEENQGVKPCVIGKIGMLPLMGCYLHPDFWRKGYATEAARALLAYYWTLPGLFLSYILHLSNLKEIHELILGKRELA